MGETAISPETTGEPTETTEPVESTESSGDAGEENQEATEVEVVRQGKDGSQPSQQHGIRKRINKLNTKVTKAEGEASVAQQELAHEREKTKLLTLALEQKSSPATPPDPADFDDGVRDPKYVKALQEVNQSFIAAEVKKQTATLSVVQPEPVDTGLERRQEAHYERAGKLGIKDFNDTEDKAIAILGSEVVNHIIRSSDKSHLVLYYLGKNPGIAEDIASLIGTDPVKATLQIGRLEAELNVKPKANSEPTPDPDSELQGGSPSAGKTNKYQRELDKAREKAQEGGSGGMKAMQAIADIKKQAIKAEVTVS